MSVDPSIKLIGRDQLDMAKWDRCIDTASNGLVYAYSYYLDQMADQWDALVMGDYEMVMPLPWKKKYGIAYLSQPFLTAQLGVFGNNIQPGHVISFLDSIPSNFKYWDFYLNGENVVELKEYDLYQRTNYVLDLNNSYDQLNVGYRENIRRNVKKAFQLGCIAKKGIDVEEVIALAIRQMHAVDKETKENVGRFRNLFKVLSEKQLATTYGILSDKNELLASAVFFYSHNRAYYILVGNSPNGKTIGASHALIDAFIKDHAGKKIKLDFEGSDIPNLAFFYSSFGAKEEMYAGIRLNRLPFYLRWLKK